jgi:hypothetical protein
LIQLRHKRSRFRLVETSGAALTRQARLRLAAAAFGLALIALIVLAAAVVAEYALADVYQWERRLVFLSEGDDFQNKDWGGFVYRPNATIRTQAWYITDLEAASVAKEYDYEIKTNAQGLVQSRDVTGARPAILFLGDSYTEGQGAPPWFYDFENHWEAPYQVINGGLMGTGFESWWRLYRDLSTKTKIAKAVLIFISDDWTRPVWQMPEATLGCLQHAARCTGIEYLYALPDDPEPAKDQILRMAAARAKSLAASQGNIVQRSALYRKALKPMLTAVVESLAARRGPSHERLQFARSAQAIIDFANALGRENVLLLHLPQKDELTSGPNRLGRKGRNFIRRGGYALADGFKTCGLTLSDFHVRDGHPNSVGYGKVRKCVERAVAEAFQLSH